MRPGPPTSHAPPLSKTPFPCISRMSWARSASRDRVNRQAPQGRTERAAGRPGDIARLRVDAWRRRVVTRAAPARCLAVVVAALIAAALPVGRAFACADFATAPTTQWSLAEEGGASWLVTPCGDRFFSLGVNVLDGGKGGHERLGSAYSGYFWKAFAPTFADWIADTRRRLRSWGFNSAGGWSAPPQALELPTVIDLELGRNARFHWFDPFAPETEARMNALARELVAPYRDSPYRIGYFSDNEVGWWAGALFVWYSKKPASSATKQRWVELLRRHYAGDWSRFAADFLPPSGVGSWDALLAATEATRMKPGGAGIHVVREWAGSWPSAITRSPKGDPRRRSRRAVSLATGLPIYYDPAAVRAMAPHVDAIATNYNVDSSDGWIADYFFDGLRKLSGGKPVLVSEWFFAARENRSANRNNGHLMTVATQEERAAGQPRPPGISPPSPKSSGCTGFSITTIRRAGAPMARITISGWSISTIGPMSS